MTVYKLDENGIWWQWVERWWWFDEWVKQYDGIDPFTGYTRTGA